MRHPPGGPGGPMIQQKECKFCKLKLKVKGHFFHTQIIFWLKRGQKTSILLLIFKTYFLWFSQFSSIRSQHLRTLNRTLLFWYLYILTLSRYLKLGYIFFKFFLWPPGITIPNSESSCTGLKPLHFDTIQETYIFYREIRIFLLLPCFNP